MENSALKILSSASDGIALVMAKICFSRPKSRPDSTENAKSQHRGVGHFSCSHQTPEDAGRHNQGEQHQAPELGFDQQAVKHIRDDAPVRCMPNAGYCERGRRRRNDRSDAQNLKTSDTASDRHLSGEFACYFSTQGRGKAEKTATLANNRYQVAATVGIRLLNRTERRRPWAA
jgi:hypothetical protein